VPVESGLSSTESLTEPSMQRLIFNAFVMNSPVHLSPGSWRRSGDTSHRHTSLAHWTELAALLELGRFDALFIADTFGMSDVYGGSPDAARRGGIQVPLHDPLLIVSAMAQATRHLSFGVTCSTTYEAPFALARRFSTLDHLSNGRIGWNVVTSASDSAARNFGLDRQLDHASRYARAEEFLDVCYKLWEQAGKRTRSCAMRNAASSSIRRGFIVSRIAANTFQSMGRIWSSRRRSERRCSIRPARRGKAARLPRGTRNACSSARLRKPL
jgi:hypothetical protein